MAVTDQVLPPISISTCKDCGYAPYGCAYKTKYTEFIRENLVERSNDIPSNMAIVVSCNYKQHGELPDYIQRILSIVGKDREKEEIE